MKSEPNYHITIMSTFLYVLLAIGLVVMKYYMEQKSKTADSPADKTLTEVFPTTSYEHEDENDDEGDWTTPHPAPVTQEEYKLETPATMRRTEPDDQTESPMIREVNGDSTPPSEKINLSTREEARRAFIYSEIFNRKYE